MLDITILKSSTWQLSIGLGGFGLVKVIAEDGKEAFATREEKNFLQDLMRCTAKLPSDHIRKVREAIYSDFCCGLFEKNTGGNTLLYHMFVGNGPEGSVYAYARGKRFTDLVRNAEDNGT